MSGLLHISWLHQRRYRPILISVALVLTVVFALLNQPAAAALIPLIAGLLAAIARRDAHAQQIAHQVAAGHTIEKLEVPAGEWGELYRAVNGLLQERRVQQRLHDALPLALPADALRSLLNGSALSTGESRVVAVLLAGCGPLPSEARTRRATFDTWRTLADVAREQAQHSGALLQLCGSGVLLVFGAFDEQPAELALQAAVRAAEALDQAWYRMGQHQAAPLTLCLAGGPALIALLPGLGYCALGPTIDQVGQLQRLAGQTARYRLLCGESAYYGLRRARDRQWERTGLYTIALDGRQQGVYGS